MTGAMRMTADGATPTATSSRSAALSLAWDGDNMTDLTEPLQKAVEVGTTTSGTLEFFDPSGAGLVELARAPAPSAPSTGN